MARCHHGLISSKRFARRLSHSTYPWSFSTERGEPISTKGASRIIGRFTCLTGQRLSVLSTPVLAAIGSGRIWACVGNLDTVARKPGKRITPLWPCARSWSSRPVLGPDSPESGPAPGGARSPVASAPGTRSSASSGIAGCRALPRWTSRPSAARPETPAPSPTPATAAFSTPPAAGRIAATGPATRSA